MPLNIKRLKENAIIPTKGSQEAAGYDLYACLDTESIEILPHSNCLIDIGWAMEVPSGYFGAIFARSGLANSQGLRPSNCVGVIDSDYRGPVKVSLHNDTDITQTVVQGQRIAQMIIMPYFSVVIHEIDDLTSTERNQGGFGSTGT